MNEIELNRKPKELIQAEKLIVEGKFEEAHQVIDKFKERGEFTLKDKLSCNLLETEIMFQQGLYEDTLKLANQIYNESLELRDKLLVFDALNLETHALFSLFRLDEALEKTKELEELVKVINQELPGDHKLRESTIDYLKAFFYFSMRDADKAEEHYKLCLALREELGDKRALAEALISGSLGFARLRSEFDQILQSLEHGLTLAKEINWKYIIARGLQTKGIIFAFKGDINQSIISYEQCLNILKKLNNKPMIANILNAIGLSYIFIGDLNRSLEYLEQSLNLSRELGEDRNTAATLLNIIMNLIENNNLERVKHYFYELEQMEICSKDNYLNTWYRFCKAFLLKTNLRAPYRGEAEVILKQLLDEEVDDYELNVEVLEELESLITQLLELAEKSHSYHLLAETYFLKGKIALLTLDMKEARKNLTQAQRIAERWGFNQLATKISLEHDKLRDQLSMWDDLREEEISLSERIKLAGMDEQIEHLLRNRAKLTRRYIRVYVHL
jgi:tetratricopeptide (TPR) repeat protein